MRKRKSEKKETNRELDSERKIERECKSGGKSEKRERERESCWSRRYSRTCVDELIFSNVTNFGRNNFFLI